MSFEQVVKLKMHVLQLLPVQKSRDNVTPSDMKLMLRDRITLSCDRNVDLTGVLSCRVTFACL